MRLVYMLVEKDTTLHSTCCYSQVHCKYKVRGVFSSKKKALQAMARVADEVRVCDKFYLDIVPVPIDSVVDIDIEELENAVAEVS